MTTAVPRSSHGRIALLAAAVLVLLGVRCAHTPRTPEERACKQRVDRCMERCEGEPVPRRADPDAPANVGCDEDIRSRCEENCYELCDW